MILPIYAYGNPILIKKATEIDPDHPHVNELITNMWETVDNAGSLGLSAPQVGHSIRLFMVDTNSINLYDPGFKAIRKTFINAQLIKESEDVNSMNESCMSIPGISAPVNRSSSIKIKYLDQNFNEVVASFSGKNARVIQHEYDHIEGILFIKRLDALKKKRLESKLKKIRTGSVQSRHKLIFAKS